MLRPPTLTTFTTNPAPHHDVPARNSVQQPVLCAARALAWRFALCIGRLGCTACGEGGVCGSQSTVLTDLQPRVALSSTGSTGRYQALLGTKWYSAYRIGQPVTGCVPACTECFVSQDARRAARGRGADRLEMGVAQRTRWCPSRPRPRPLPFCLRGRRRGPPPPPLALSLGWLLGSRCRISVAISGPHICGPCGPWAVQVPLQAMWTS
jgi:hypothetical protein